MNDEIERIRLRCVCDEDGCWKWTGSVTRDGLPTLSRVVDGKRKTMSARRWVYQANGRRLWAGDMVSPSCGVASCLNPDHLKRTNRAAILRRSYEQDPGQRIRRGAAIRAAWKVKGKGHKLTQEQADYARDPSRPAKQVAQELGVSSSLVNYIRRGQAWKATASPLTRMAAMLAANDSTRRAA